MARGRVILAGEGDAKSWYWKIRKLRAEVEEAEQARKDKLVREARYIEAEVKEAKDTGVGRSIGEAEEEGSRRSISTREIGVE